MYATKRPLVIQGDGYVTTYRPDFTYTVTDNKRYRSQGKVALIRGVVHLSDDNLDGGVEPVFSPINGENADRIKAYYLLSEVGPSWDVSN